MAAAPSLRRRLLAHAALAAVVVVLAAAGSPAAAAPRRYRVGGNDGWRVPPPEEKEAYYVKWASTIAFYVDDFIEFAYRNDTVIKVSKAGYYHCNETSGIGGAGAVVPRDGSTIFLLDQPGYAYFASADLGHCNDGERLAINVLTATGPPVPRSSPSPAAAPGQAAPPPLSPSSAPGPAPSPSTGRATAAAVTSFAASLAHVLASAALALA